jgi:colanic acid/amylovoran biosynthesis glycosyltransferase
MRIALVVDQYPELSETFVAAEAAALRDLGHAVSVEAGRHASSPAPDGGPPGVPVAYWSDDSAAVRASALAWLVARHPLRCLVDLLSRRRWRREEGLRRLRTLAPAVRRVRRGRVEHLHAHFAAEAAMDAMRIGALLRLPYSVMTHGYDVFRSPRNLLEKHDRAEFAVTPCEYSVRHLRDEFGAQARRLVVGVDPDAFVRAAPYPGGRTVLAVGRLVEKKGFGVLVEAAALRRFDRVLIAGDGPLRGELAERVEALGLGAVVELVGPVTPDRVRELLEGADVLAAPCVVAADGDRDTMPVVVKEALAMEVPVVASDAVGLPEIVRPEWGRLVPAGDAEALAAELDELLSLPAAARAAMGRAGRDWVIESANLRTETARLAAWIAEGVDAHRARSPWNALRGGAG